MSPPIQGLQGGMAHAPAKQKQQEACQPLAQGGRVGQEQEKLEPPSAVQEEGQFTLTINDGGLQGWRLTPPPI